MSTTTRSIATATALAFSLLLAGCGSPPADGGSYGTIDELKEAAVKAGVDCPDWDPHNKATYASSSASCSDSIGLATYANDSQLNAQLDAWKVVGEVIELERLVGKNWTIDVADPEALQKKMGGTVFRTPGK